jgi:hypothetical protein
MACSVTATSTLKATPLDEGTLPENDRLIQNPYRVRYRSPAGLREPGRRRRPTAAIMILMTETVDVWPAAAEFDRGTVSEVQAAIEDERKQVLDLVAAALLEQCVKLVRDGLRRDYVRRQSLEPVLRGHLDFAAQVTRRYGQLDQLHIRTFDRETDIWDNRVLGMVSCGKPPATPPSAGPCGSDAARAVRLDSGCQAARSSRAPCARMMSAYRYPEPLIVRACVP